MAKRAVWIARHCIYTVLLCFQSVHRLQSVLMEGKTTSATVIYVNVELDFNCLTILAQTVKKHLLILLVIRHPRKAERLLSFHLLLAKSRNIAGVH